MNLVELDHARRKLRLSFDQSQVLAGGTETHRFVGVRIRLDRLCRTTRRAGRPSVGSGFQGQVTNVAVDGVIV